MPTVTANGIEIHYAQEGEGPDLLLIMGLGADHRAWDALAERLTASFRVTRFDNRGVGETEKAAGPYSMAMMADDAAGVLDALGIARTHVFGISMGGMIAQHLTVRHPSRVDRLILGCTAAGGPRATQPAPWVIGKLMTPALGLSAEEQLETHGPILFAESFIRDHRDIALATFERAVERPTPPATYSAQVGAIMTHDATDGLTDVGVPTLVVTGGADVLVPPANSVLLAELIPGAELLTLPGVGHALNLEAIDELDAALGRFLLGRVPARVTER